MSPNQVLPLKEYPIGNFNPSDVIAIIVTYNPDSDFEENIKSVYRNTPNLVVVDNSPDPESMNLIQSLKAKYSFHLINNDFNLGIAFALNQGLDFAKEKNFSWVLTLDQDSTLDDNYLLIMFETYKELSAAHSIAILAPVHYDKKTGYMSKIYRFHNKKYLKKEIVMTSGNLVKMSLFDQIGVFDEDLFIEYVDHDLCLKLKKFGFEIYIVKQARLGHSLGDTRKHVIGPYFFFSHNYLPVRRYYRARNRLVLYRRHFGKWILHDQLFAIKDMIKILMVETYKWKKVKATILGTFDGLLGRMGAYEGATYKTPKANRYFVEFRKEILPLLPDYAEKVLDLGCGTGETSGYLKEHKRFGWVCGVEGSPAAVLTAKKRLDQVLEGDIESIQFPFQEKSFDLILTLDILEHLVDPWTTIQKLKKILKPNGRLIVSMPNVRHASVLVPLLFFGDWKYTQQGLLDSTHIRFFTKKTVIQIFTQEGFVIEKIDHTGAKKNLSAILNRITFGLLKDFVVYQYLFSFRLPELPMEKNQGLNPHKSLGNITLTEIQS